MYTEELLGTEGLKMCFCLFQPIFNSVSGIRSIQIRSIVIQEILGKVNKPKQVRNKRIQESSTPVHHTCGIFQPARRVKNVLYNHINVIQAEEFTDQSKKMFDFYTVFL
jgi:hypothetical protein